jgi:hydroxymethylpyrimidine/phosphomethylpyrimidine kinase
MSKHDLQARPIYRHTPEPIEAHLTIVFAALAVKAENATMLPVINAFKAAHKLTDVTVVADAVMISEANQIALQAPRRSRRSQVTRRRTLVSASLASLIRWK